MRIGYANSAFGDYTERLEIVSETVDGKYVVRHFTITRDLYDKSFVVTGALQLRKKEDVRDIKEIDKP